MKQHVDQQKINLVESILTDPIVGPLWEKYLSLQHKSLMQREIAWNEYCVARDKFLGLPPLVKITPTSQKRTYYAYE